MRMLLDYIFIVQPMLLTDVRTFLRFPHQFMQQRSVLLFDKIIELMAQKTKLNWLSGIVQNYS